MDRLPALALADRGRRGKHLPEPILANYHNIERRDAVLAWDAIEPLLDAAGQPVTRWDGRTTKTHPVTGEQVPDEAARSPRTATSTPARPSGRRRILWWGIRRSLGTADARALGDGYAEALRRRIRRAESADYVMYWWDKAAESASHGEAAAFRLHHHEQHPPDLQPPRVQRHMDATPPLSLLFAIPDHPWVTTADGAGVRIAMTVASKGE